MRRTAFTILEVILVLAIMIVIAGIGWPSMEAMQGDFKVSAAADQVRGAWAEARARAAEDNLPYRFAVIPYTGKYRIAPDAGEFWGAGEGGSSVETDSQPLVHEDALPDGVMFADSADGGGEGGGDWTTVATFQSDGSARENVEIFFRASGARPLVLKLRGLTGAVSSGRVGG